MPSSTPASLTPATVLKMLRDHAWVWIAPAVAGLVLTAGATLVTPRKWKATQGMIVRSEAAGYADQRLGKFTDLSEMRTVQETVLELARSRGVLFAALKEVGVGRTLFGGVREPSAKEIESLRDHLQITPPGGAEFGATEVFYLTVLDTDSDRAVQLADAVARHLDLRMRRLRREQAASMVSELKHATEAARDGLASHTATLAAMESEVGSELADLRNLVSPLGGQGALAQQALSIEAELRATTAASRQNAELLTTLRASKNDPSRLLATPSALFASQPALERLKAGLVDAQMRAASLQGTRSPGHPFVVAAKEAERQHREELHREIPTAIAGVELEQSLSKQREASLRGELETIKGRLATLAGRRAEYSMLVAAVENQTSLVDAAEKQLADARAHAAGAGSSSVLGRVGSVEAGIRPVGPGRATVSLAGGLGGLVLGLGIVFMFFAPKVPAQANEESVRPGAWDEMFPAAAPATRVATSQSPAWAPVSFDATGQSACVG